MHVLIFELEYYTSALISCYSTERSCPTVYPIIDVLKVVIVFGSLLYTTSLFTNYASASLYPKYEVYMVCLLIG